MSEEAEQFAPSVVPGVRTGPEADDGTARVWNATTGNELLTLRGHVGEVRDATFGPDVIVTAGDGTTRIWDAPRK